MKVTGASSDGYVMVDGALYYFIRARSNTPYCHFCRQRVDVVADLSRGATGNPRHACKSCLRKLLDGLEVVENEWIKTGHADAVAEGHTTTASSKS